MGRIPPIVAFASALIAFFSLSNLSDADSVQDSAAQLTVSEPQKADQITLRTSIAKPDLKSVGLFRHADYPSAWTASQESNRPILVYVTMPRCGHCVKMIEETYKQPEVGKLVADGFETICADRYAQAKLVEKLNVKWYPTTILVASNNKVLDVIEGYVDANTFKRRLQLGLAASSRNQTR